MFYQVANFIQIFDYLSETKLQVDLMHRIPQFL